MSYVIYLKSNSKDEIQISDKKEWKFFFEESGRSIFELIDSKNTLKIEYKCKPVTNTIIEKNILLENEKFGIELLKSVFNLSLRNETSKKRIKDDLINSEVLTSSNINLKNDINNFINCIEIQLNQYLLQHLNDLFKFRLECYLLHFDFKINKINIRQIQLLLKIFLSYFQFYLVIIQDPIFSFESQ
jgi:hypothetical protein